MVLRSRGLPFAALALRCSAAQKCRQPSEGANPPPSPARTSRCARGGSPPRVWRWGWSRRRPRRGSAGRRHPPLLRCGRFSCSACCSARRRLLAASPRRSRRSRPLWFPRRPRPPVELLRPLVLRLGKWCRRQRPQLQQPRRRHPRRLWPPVEADRPSLGRSGRSLCGQSGSSLGCRWPPQPGSGCSARTPGRQLGHLASPPPRLGSPGRRSSFLLAQRWPLG